jgi:hypothetical protein
LAGHRWGSRAPHLAWSGSLPDPQHARRPTHLAVWGLRPPPLALWGPWPPLPIAPWGPRPPLPIAPWGARPLQRARWGSRPEPLLVRHSRPPHLSSRCLRLPPLRAAACLFFEETRRRLSRVRKGGTRVGAFFVKHMCGWCCEPEGSTGQVNRKGNFVH